MLLIIIINNFFLLTNVKKNASTAGYLQTMTEASDSDALLAEEDRKKNLYGAMKSKPIPIKSKFICNMILVLQSCCNS